LADVEDDALLRNVVEDQETMVEEVGRGRVVDRGGWRMVRLSLLVVFLLEGDRGRGT